MTKRAPEPAEPWREVLCEAFDHVQAIGGLFALDLEYYLDRKNRKRCYRLLWTNRLAAETKSGKLVCNESGVIRTGHFSETMNAVSETLATLCQLRKRQSPSAKQVAA